MSIYVDICRYLSISIDIRRYMQISVDICRYTSIYVDICRYTSMYVVYTSMCADICLYLSISVEYTAIYEHVCRYMQIYVDICKCMLTAEVEAELLIEVAVVDAPVPDLHRVSAHEGTADVEVPDIPFSNRNTTRRRRWAHSQAQIVG